MGKKGQSKQPPTPLKTTIDCKNAIVAYKKGDYNGALRAIRNCQSSYGDSAVYHHAVAFIHYKLAMQNEDSKIVRKHIEDAFISALQASSLFPSSTIVAHFCACTLYDLASFNQEYDEVIKQCNIALDIKNPKNPESDSFVFKDLSQQMETEKMKLHLRDLIKKSERKKRWVSDDSEKRLEERIKAMEERVRMAEDKITSLRKSLNYKFESFSGQTSLTKRRKKNKSVANGEREQKVRSFWNSEMSADEKRNLFEVRIEELKTYLCSIEDHNAMDLLLEAIDFYRMCKSWKFWECCVKFVDRQSYTEHLYDSHEWKIHPDLLSDLPPQVDENSVEVIMKGEWKPADIEQAIKIMDNQFRLDLCTDESGTCAEKGLHEHKACSAEDVSVVIDGENRVKRLLFGSRTDQNLSRIAAIDDLKWPLCDNRERAALLEEVCDIFRLLLRYNCPMQHHVDWVIEYTIDELKMMNLDSKLWNQMPKNIKLVFLLDSLQLETILSYLQCVSGLYCSSKIPKMGNFMDEQLIGDQAFVFKEKVVLGEDFSCLITVACDGSAVTTAESFHGDCVLPGNDDILSWLYAGQGIREALELWETLRDSQEGQARLFFQVFELEHEQLEKMCKKQRENMEKLEAAMTVERICAEEIERRKQGPQYVAQTFASLLRKRQKELIESNDKAKTTSQLELDFILNVLEEAQAVTAYQLEKNSRMQDNLNISDDFLEEKIGNWMVSQLGDLRSIAIIMRSIGVMSQYGLQLERLSTFDYQLVLLPILKSFMRSRLEDLAHKEAEEKSEAARETLIAELDAMENINKGSDIRKIREKSTNKKNKKKKKKKKKDQREAKDFKAIEDIEQPLLPEEKVEQIDHPELEIGVSVNADEQDQQKSEVPEKVSVHQMQSLDTGCMSIILGPGLKNEVGESNCFLNVIIQSLWHLRTFRNKFMNRSKLDHKHVGDPCVACALHDVFAALHKASSSYKESINPTPLRIALSNLYTKHKLFKMQEMNDARQCLEAILWRLHQSFSSGGALPDFPPTSTCDGSSNPCLVHEIFGIKINNHGYRPIHQSNISEVIYIDADDLRKLKSRYGNYSFDQLVEHELEGIVKRRAQSDPSAGDWLPPHVFRIVLEHETHPNSPQDISETCSSLLTKLDISAHSQGLDPGNKYILISMVCYHPSELHYSCFIYNHEHQRYVSYNDQYVKEIGNWDDVFNNCIQSRMLPYILIFETKNLEDLSDKGATQKSEAAKEAPSAQHALDTKKNINEDVYNVRQKEDDNNKKKKKKSFRKTKESKATGDSDNFQLHQNDAEQDKNQNSEIGDKEKLLGKDLEYQKNEHMVECIEENVEAGVSAVHSIHPEDDKEKRYQADIRKAVRLSLDCFENQNGPLPPDVKDGTTPRLDVHRYVIIQSQWRLRQLQDEFISRSEIPHIHNRDLCLLCAYRDSYTAMRIASRDEPREDSALAPRTHSRILPIDQFMKERANKKDGVNEDATKIGIPESAYELENQLAALVRNIAEELEQERQSKKRA